MGFRICTIASPVSPEELTQALGLVESGPQHAGMPDGTWWVTRLRATGWSLLWSENPNFGFENEERLRALSETGAEVVLCEVNETDMCSAAEGWKDGRSLWRIAHSGDGMDRFDLYVKGTPPAGFEAIHERHVRAQKAGDGRIDHVFEIPLDVAASLHGFRHDSWLAPEQAEGFTPVAPATAPRGAPAGRGGWIARLFGR